MSNPTAVEAGRVCQQHCGHDPKWMRDGVCFAPVEFSDSLTCRHRCRPSPHDLARNTPPIDDGCSNSWHAKSVKRGTRCPDCDAGPESVGAVHKVEPCKEIEPCAEYPRVESEPQRCEFTTPISTEPKEKGTA